MSVDSVAGMVRNDAETAGLVLASARWLVALVEDDESLLPMEVKARVEAMLNDPAAAVGWMEDLVSVTAPGHEVRCYLEMDWETGEIRLTVSDRGDSYGLEYFEIEQEG